MYRALDAVLARMAVRPGDMPLPAWPDLADDSADPSSCRAWLRGVWSRESYAEAITLASPVLAAQVVRACDGQHSDPRRLRRMVVSVARYLLRMAGRSIPFGLFAGVAPARLGPRASVRWGERHRPVVRADAVWLTSAVARLEACPQLLRRLPVIANNLGTVGGGRLVLPFQETGGGAAASPGLLVDVSVKHTRAVEAALRHAHSPIELSVLVEKLAVEFPRASPSVIEAMLVDLVAQRLLLTSLRPASTVTDGLGHVVAQLRAVAAESIAEVAELASELYVTAEEMSRHNRAPAPGERTTSRAGLIERMRQVNPSVEQPIMVDLRVDIDLTLPGTLVRETESAAAVLTLLSPYPSGLPAWSEFHAAFLERYGVDATVPLLELISPDTGLGLPATYRGSTRTVTPSPLSERDRQLLALVQKATFAGRDEIVLDDQMVAALVDEPAGRQQVPPHVELFVQIHAATCEAVERGDYELVVTGAARAAGATTGRFLDLLDEPGWARFRDAYASVPILRAGAVPAQVSCPPVRTQSQNVARAPSMLGRVIPVGEHRDPAADTLTLADLAVGGDADGLYLISLPDRRVIEPTALNAVEFRHFSQPLARFLCEVSRSRAAVYMPFSWGAASSMPFLPRIRYGRTVLAPARWRLEAADLPGKSAPWRRWRDALAAWRQGFRLPERVHLVEGDNRLPLDLDQDLPAMLLRSHLDRTGHARLEEAPPTSAYGWLGGHTHEIVVPLVATLDPIPAPPQLADVRPVRRDDAHLPGTSSWLFAKLYSHHSRHTAILTDLAGVLAGWDPPMSWWYVPYRDPEEHLRVRLRLPGSDDYGVAAGRLGQWAARLRERGLLGRMQLDTYHPETGRYGHGQAMAAAERVFAADSAAALAQRRMAAGAGVDADAVAVASHVDLAIAFAGATAAGMRWLADHLPHEPAPVDRALHATATRTADPRGDWAILRTMEGGNDVLAAWRRRRTTLADYRQALAAQRERDPLRVLPSLLHMHQIRMFGIDPDRERSGRRLARAAAQRWLATSIEATP